MPTEITLRRNKSQPLTFDEVDNNFENLKATADAAATGSGLAALTAEVSSIDSELNTLTVRVDTIEGDYTTAAQAETIADDSVAAHVALPDPHTQYLTDADSVSYADTYNSTGVTAVALAAGLGDGATVITDRDETAGGVQTRRVVTSGVLGAAVNELDAGQVEFTSAGSGAVATTSQAKLRESVSVKDFGAKGDARTLTNGAITSGTAAFTSATAGFTAADVGKVISVYGAGAAGVTLTTTISAFVSSTQVILTDAASTTVSGATFHYGTDDTAAFNAVLAFYAANRVNARGLGRIYVPRGRYLCNGTTDVASPLTLIWEGDGVEATQIIRTIDTGNLFRLATYIYVEFSNMWFNHLTGNDRASWTSHCFDINGTGGGREFCLRRVQINGFNRQISHNTGGNEDTNYFEGCTFNNFKTFLRARNSQAVVNKIVQCTWFGTTERVFDTSGFGHTHIDTANIVQSGTFLYLANGSSGPASQYLISNAKFEFWNGVNNNSLLGTTKVLEIENNAANVAYIKFEKSGISGGTPDPAVYQWDLQGGNYTVEVNGGQWGSTLVQTRARTVQGGHNAWWVRFFGCTTSPSRTINRIAGAAGSHHVPVVFNSCLGVENILLRGPGGATGGNGKIAGVAMDRNFNTKSNNSYLVLGNTTTTHTFLSYGQVTLVDRVRVAVNSKSGWTGAEIKAFADAGLTIQIGATLTPAGGTGTTPEVHEIVVPAGTFTTDGVYVTVTCTNAGGGAEGLVFVDTLSV